jgi:arginase
MDPIVVPFFMGEAMSFLGQIPVGRELAPALPEAGPQERIGALCRCLADRVAAETAPVVVAGDCMAVIGVLAGLQRREVDPVLVWFDAHGDFHTWETTATGFLGGMPLAMLTGRGAQTIVRTAGLRPLPDDRVVLVDGRDLDPGEDAALAASGIEVVPVGDVAGLGPRGALVVHLDVDVVDPADLPAVNYPASGGPSLEEVRAALESLAAPGRVAAVSVSSWAPELPGARESAEAGLGLLEAVGARL